MAAGYGDRALEADFGDVLDDPLEHLLVADARSDDGDPVNRAHLDALGGERHGLCLPRYRRAICERQETAHRVEAASVERTAIVICEPQTAFGTRYARQKERKKDEKGKR